MTVTVTWQAALETGDVSEFDASVTMNSGTAPILDPPPSSVTTTTNATASTTDKKTGTHSLRLGGTVTAVQESVDPIIGFWIKPAGGNAGANYFRIRSAVILSQWFWDDSSPPGEWVLTNYKYDTATWMGIQAGSVPGTIRIESHLVIRVETPEYEKHEEVATFTSDDIPIREGVWQHWQIDARDFEHTKFWIDSEEIAVGGSEAGKSFVQFGGSGSLSNYTYVDNIYMGTTDAAADAFAPSPDYRWELVATVLTLSEPTPADVVDGYGAYAEGEIDPTLYVDGYGAYAEGAADPAITVDGFGVYAQLMVVRPTVLLFDGHDLSEWMQNAKLEATINQIEKTHFESLAHEADPGLARYAFPFGGMLSAEIARIMGPRIGKKIQLRIQFYQAIYTWAEAMLIDYTMTVTSPADGQQWMATVVGLGVPVRTFLT